MEGQKVILWKDILTQYFEVIMMLIISKLSIHLNI